MPKYMTAREIRERFEVAFSTHQADALTEVLTALETERVAEMAEIRENLTTLVEVTARLAQAQARTDESVKTLAQVQARTDESVKTLAQAQARTDESVKTLAQVQARTDESVKTLAQVQARTDESVKTLAQAQARTDESVKTLAQTQARTDESVKELAQAQARTDDRLTRVEIAVEKLAQAQAQTEVAIQKLSLRIDDLAAQVGGLSNRFGFSLEEFSQALLPPWLEHYYGITNLYLERSYLKLPFGEYVEADLAGEGKREGKPLLVLVECRSMIGGSETRRLAEKMAQMVSQWEDTPRESFRAIVAMNIHPTAVPVAEELGVVLIPYSKINRERF
jgi:chemotaxis protein histidine kinase CheA